MESPIIIAGGGAAGRAAAQTLLAGTSAPLLHIAGPQAEAIDRTLVDKAIMTGRVTAERAAAMRPPLDGLVTRFDTVETVELLGAPERPGTGESPDVRAGTAAGPRVRVVLGSGEQMEARGLVLATGSVPRRLEVPGAAQWTADGRMTTLHAVADADAIRLRLETTGPARVLVSGAGLVGSEAASLLHEAGHTITLVASSSNPGAAALGTALATRMADLHRAAVDARFGTPIVALRADGAVLSDGAEVPADLVIVAHGAVPRLPHGWWTGPASEAAAGASGAAGLPVDDRLRVRGALSVGAAEATVDIADGDGDVADGDGGAAAADAVVGVVAAGAIARWGPPPHRIDHWDDAEAQGAHAARTLLHDLGAGEDPGPYRSWSPWSARIHGRRFAGFGHPLPGAQWRTVTDEPLLVEAVAPDGHVSAVAGLDAGRALRDRAAAVCA